MELQKYHHLDIIDKNERIFKAWATTNIKDLQGETVQIDDIEKYLPTFMDRSPSLVVEHSSKVVGKILNTEVKEKNTGVRGVLATIKVFRNTSIDNEAWDGILNSKYTGLSIGGECEHLPNGVLKNVKLWEVSLVERPANPDATMVAVNTFAKSEVCPKCRGEIDDKSDTNIKGETPERSSDTMAKEVVTKEKPKEEELPEEKKTVPKEEEEEKPEEKTEEKPEEKPKEKEAPAEPAAGPSVEERIARLEAMVTELVQRYSATPAMKSTPTPVVKAKTPRVETFDGGEAMETIVEKKAKPWETLRTFADIKR